MYSVLSYIKYLSLNRKLNQTAEIDRLVGFVQMLVFSISIFASGAILGVIFDEAGPEERISLITILLSAFMDWFIKLIFHETTDCKIAFYTQPIKRNKVIAFNWTWNFFTWDNYVSLLLVTGIFFFGTFTSYTFILVIILNSTLTTSFIIVLSEVLNQKQVSYRIITIVSFLVYILLCYFYVTGGSYLLSITLWIICFCTLCSLYFYLNRYPSSYSTNSKISYKQTNVSIIYILLKQIFRTNIKRTVLYNLLCTGCMIAGLCLNKSYLDEEAWIRFAGISTLLIGYMLPLSLLYMNGFMVASQYFDAILCFKSQGISDYIWACYKIVMPFIICISMILYVTFSDILLLSAGIYATGIMLCVSFLNFIFNSRRWDTIKNKSPNMPSINAFSIIEMFLNITPILLFCIIYYHFNHVVANIILIGIGGLGIIIAPLWIKVISSFTHKQRHMISSKYKIK